VKRLLADEPARRSIAAAGQMRTLAEHGYDARMVELLELLGPLARHGPTRRSAVAAGR
jgi:spore maturation protein CgeB